MTDQSIRSQAIRSIVRTMEDSVSQTKKQEAPSVEHVRKALGPLAEKTNHEFIREVMHDFMRYMDAVKKNNVMVQGTIAGKYTAAQIESINAAARRIARGKPRKQKGGKAERVSTPTIPKKSLRERVEELIKNPTYDRTSGRENLSTYIHTARSTLPSKYEQVQQLRQLFETDHALREKADRFIQQRKRFIERKFSPYRTYENSPIAKQKSQRGPYPPRPKSGH